MITSAGVGSGLDIESIITQLMQVEREPLNNLDRKQQDLDIKISALGNLKSAISELESTATSIGDTSKFGGYDAISLDEDVFTAEAVLGTQVGNHTIEVLGLAKAHQLASEPYPDGPDSTINNQTISFSSGDENFDITVDGTNNTLFGLRDAINGADDNTTISASILNLDGGSRLIVTAKSTGTESAITVSGTLFDEVSPAVDATFTVDGFSASSQTNSFSDVIPGVTLNLFGEGTANLETVRKTDSFRELTEQFVANYNSLISNVDSLSEGDLSSDGTLRSIKSDISRLFFDPIEVKASEYTPYNLGLTFDRNGVLSINESVFSTVSEDDTENFVAAMTDPDVGFSKRVLDALERYSDSEGLLATKEDSFDTRKRNLEDQSGRLEYRLEQTEARYRRQFSALDTLMSQLQSTSSYLTDQLAALSATNNQS